VRDSEWSGTTWDLIATIDKKSVEVDKLGDRRLVTFRSGFKSYEKFDGVKWINHREDGPASMYANGTQQYWLEGKLYDKEEWIKRTTKLGRILYG
jgi:hypothetical protein